MTNKERNNVISYRIRNTGTEKKLEFIEKKTDNKYKKNRNALGYSLNLPTQTTTPTTDAISQ